ncbi:unnamed protein product [Adineta ricciae]|uniref:Uncharacterized protein n=1 Tax=Adineta ricciae TaxID=249248 RepID=A0A816E5R5_ADIRI|nr:unnamed protein product [Adineta ricciae]
MITDCDRLQTDIIELDDFEPEKDWRRAQHELRLLLNDKMPQATSDIMYCDVEEGHCQSCYKTNKIYIDFDNAIHEGMSLTGLPIWLIDVPLEDYSKQYYTCQQKRQYYLGLK